MQGHEDNSGQLSMRPSGRLAPLLGMLALVAGHAGATEGALGRSITGMQITSYVGIVPPESGMQWSLGYVNYDGSIGASRQAPIAGEVALGLQADIDLFSATNPSVMNPLTTGLGNSVTLAVVTVVIVIVLLAPTMILVNLRFSRMKAVFEFIALLPISIPAIVVVVGLTPIYLQIGRTLGTGAWTLAFAYGVTVLPFAYRSIQASPTVRRLKSSLRPRP